MTTFVPDKELHRVYEGFLDRMDSSKKDLDAYLRKLQGPYVRSLPEGFLQALLFYSNRGDSIINTYLRTRSLTPANIDYIHDTYTQYHKTFVNKNTNFFRLLEGFQSDDPTIISSAIESFAFMIQYIIEKAPRGKSFYVARGAISEYIETSDSFLSTSIDVDAAQSFSIAESPRCDAKYQFVKSLKITKKTPFLYLRSMVDSLIESDSPPTLPRFVNPDIANWNQIKDEYEVLLPPKIEISLVKAYLRKQDERVVAQSLRGIRHVQMTSAVHSIEYEYDICGFYMYECRELGDRGARSMYSIRTRKSKSKRNSTRSKNK